MVNPISLLGHFLTIDAVPLERPVSDPKPALQVANPTGRFWPISAVYAFKV